MQNDENINSRVFTNSNLGQRPNFALGSNISDYFSKVNTSTFGTQTDPIATTPFLNSYSNVQLDKVDKSTSTTPYQTTRSTSTTPLYVQMEASNTGATSFSQVQSRVPTDSPSTSESSPEAFASEELPQRNPIEDPLDYTAAAEASTPATLVAGAITSNMVSSFTNSQNQDNLNAAHTGLGPLGYSLQAENNANIQNTFNSKMSSVEQFEIGVGAMAGPEGLAAGIGLATATNLISSNYSPSNVTVPTNIGTQVTPT
jgi:hypothetical protein